MSLCCDVLKSRLTFERQENCAHWRLDQKVGLRNFVVEFGRVLNLNCRNLLSVPDLPNPVPCTSGIDKSHRWFWSDLFQASCCRCNVSFLWDCMVGHILFSYFQIVGFLFYDRVEQGKSKLHLLWWEACFVSWCNHMGEMPYYYYIRRFPFEFRSRKGMGPSKLAISNCGVVWSRAEHDTWNPTVVHWCFSSFPSREWERSKITRCIDWYPSLLGPVHSTRTWPQLTRDQRLKNQYSL